MTKKPCSNGDDLKGIVLRSLAVVTEYSLTIVFELPELYGTMVCLSVNRLQPTVEKCMTRKLQPDSSFGRTTPTETDSIAAQLGSYRDLDFPMSES